MAKITVSHPEMGVQEFTERTWELLGRNKQGWTIVAAKPPAEVVEKIKAKQTQNEQDVSSDIPKNGKGHAKNRRTGKRAKGV
ncbi:MAG: hypothetical protein KDC70_00235 [Saprospiraceae bacterium]|nr:hypothetical protein [Saprospiraceae bacterium]